jgi:hypothetical protein
VLRLTAAALVSALVAVAAAVLAAVTLRAIADPPIVEVSIPPSQIKVDSTSVTGAIRDGLPQFELHWDGQPPSAVLVDVSTGAALAAPAFSDATFAQNRNAVRFANGNATFVLARDRWSPDLRLSLRVEAVRARTWFLVWGTVASVAAMLFLVLLAAAAARRIAQRDADAARLHFAGSLVFIAIAAGTFTSLYPGAPVRVDEWTDEAAINSFAAARDNPSRFALDKLLSTPSNYAWYTPAYVHTVRAFKRLGFHYQTSLAFLGGAGALIFLFGLRRLFVQASGRADVALAAALALALVFDERVPPAGEMWSIVWIVPRTVFSAFVPWVMLLALACVRSPRRWWIPCVAATLLINIHPLSVPALVGAVLAAMFVANDEPITLRVSGAALAAVGVAVTMLPYALVFFSHYGAAPAIDAETTERALALIRASFTHVRETLVLRELMAHRIETLRILLDVAAVVLLLRARANRCVRFYAGCVAGFMLVTLVLPAVDAAAAGLLNRRPLEYELIRSIRYLDFLIVAGICVAVGSWRGTARQARVAAAVVCLCVVAGFGPAWLKTARVIAGRSRYAWRMVVMGRPDSESAAAQEVIRAVMALRSSDERVSGPIGLRQFGVPIAWTERDIAAQSYSVSEGLVEAGAVVPRAMALFARPLTDESVDQLSSILDAQLFLVRRRQLSPSLEASPRVLFRNAVYAIVCAPPRQRAADGKVGRSTAHEIVDVSTAKV